MYVRAHQHIFARMYVFAPLGILGCLFFLFEGKDNVKPLYVSLYIGFSLLVINIAQLTFGQWEHEAKDPTFLLISLVLPSIVCNFFAQLFWFSVFYNIATIIAFIIFGNFSDLQSSFIFLYVVSLLCALTMFSINGYLRELRIRLNFANQVSLIKAEDRSFGLLRIMLPESVITRLECGDDFIYTSYDNATVMFSHIHGFDRLTSELSSIDVLRLLNEIFSVCDELVDKHQVFKVETIGDVYMVSSGCPEEYIREDHVCAVACLALDMQNIIQDFCIERNADTTAAETPLANTFTRYSTGGSAGDDEHNTNDTVHANGDVATSVPLKLNIGIHTGSLIAGVVGQKYPRFRLMGDTVNTAARMSTSCRGGETQLTHAAYKLLPKTHFTCEDQGTKPVKGKGMMRCWLLKSQSYISQDQLNSAGFNDVLFKEHVEHSSVSASVSVEKDAGAGNNSISKTSGKYGTGDMAKLLPNHGTSFFVLNASQASTTAPLADDPGAFVAEGEGDTANKETGGYVKTPTNTSGATDQVTQTDSITSCMSTQIKNRTKELRMSLSMQQTIDGRGNDRAQSDQMSTNDTTSRDNINEIDNKSRGAGAKTGSERPSFAGRPTNLTFKRLSIGVASARILGQNLASVTASNLGNISEENVEGKKGIHYKEHLDKTELPTFSDFLHEVQPADTLVSIGSTTVPSTAATTRSNTIINRRKMLEMKSVGRTRTFVNTGTDALKRTSTLIMLRNLPLRRGNTLTKDDDLDSDDDSYAHQTDTVYRGNDKGDDVREERQTMMVMDAEFEEKGAVQGSAEKYHVPESVGIRKKGDKDDSSDSDNKNGSSDKHSNIGTNDNDRKSVDLKAYEHTASFRPLYQRGSITISELTSMPSMSPWMESNENKCLAWFVNHFRILKYSDESIEKEFLREYYLTSRDSLITWVEAFTVFILIGSIYETMNTLTMDNQSTTNYYAWVCRLVGIMAGVLYKYKTYDRRTRTIPQLEELTAATLSIIGMCFIATQAVMGNLEKNYGIATLMVMLSVVTMFSGLRYVTSVITTTALMFVYCLVASVTGSHFATVVFLLIAETFMYSSAAFEKERVFRDNFLRIIHHRTERDKAHKLLLQMLPFHITQAIRNSTPGHVIAHDIEFADIFFCDIVSFTTLCGEIEAEDVVVILNLVFEKFDELTTLHSVYKVETIGDAYVACAGVVHTQPNHTESLVNCALDFQKASAYFYIAPLDKQLRFRIGIHSGPIIAGVVGKKMPRYHLFGESLTMAEDVEANGLPEKVTISSSTYQSLLDLGLADQYYFHEHPKYPSGASEGPRYIVSFTGDDFEDNVETENIDDLVQNNQQTANAEKNGSTTETEKITPGYEPDDTLLFGTVNEEG